MSMEMNYYSPLSSQSQFTKTSPHSTFIPTPTYKNIQRGSYGVPLPPLHQQHQPQQQLHQPQPTNVTTPAASLPSSTHITRSPSPAMTGKHGSSVGSPSDYTETLTYGRNRAYSSTRKDNYHHSLPHTIETQTIDTPTCLSSSPGSEGNGFLGTPVIHRSDIALSVTAPTTPLITLTSAPPSGPLTARDALSSSSSSSSSSASGSGNNSNMLSPTTVPSSTASNMPLSPKAASEGNIVREGSEPPSVKSNTCKINGITKTLYINNIPRRIMEDDIHNLFKMSPGYISARMRRTKSDNYIAFVEFDSIQNAYRAKRTFTGYNFDIEAIVNDDSGIFIEFSRKDSSSSTATSMSSFAPLYTCFHNVAGTSLQTPTGIRASMETNVNSPHGSVSPRAMSTPFDSPSPAYPACDNYTGRCIYNEDYGNDYAGNGHCDDHFYSHPVQPAYKNEQIEDEELDRILSMNRGAFNETLYVEGVPIDASKREMAHIFRPYPGYKEVRLFLKKDKFTKKNFYLCFVDFDTPKHAYAALTSLQGYKMDLNCADQRGITIYFSRTKKLF